MKTVNDHKSDKQSTAYRLLSGCASPKTKYVTYSISDFLKKVSEIVLSTLKRKYTHLNFVGGLVHMAYEVLGHTAGGVPAEATIMHQYTRIKYELYSNLIGTVYSKKLLSIQYTECGCVQQPQVTLRQQTDTGMRVAERSAPYNEREVLLVYVAAAAH